MNAVLTVGVKEVRDTLRDRRAVISSLSGALFGPLLFAVIMNFTVERTIDEGEEAIEIPILNAAEAPNLVAYLAQHMIDAKAGAFDSREALRESVRRGETDVGLVIDEGFGTALGEGKAARVWVVSDGGNASAQTAVARVRGALRSYSRLVGVLRLQLRGVDPGITRPLAVLSDDVSTPSGRSVLLLGAFTYFLLFSCLLGGVHVAVDSTAGERERGSLEPLLTLPVSRCALVGGKFAATAFFMAVSLGIGIAAFAVAVDFLPLAEVGMDANLGLVECALAFAVLLPVAILGAGLLIAVTSFTKSFKEAQSYTGIAMLLPTLPIILVVLNPMQPTIPMMLVPSLSQHLLITSVVKTDSIDPLFFAVSAASTVVIGVLFGLMAVWRYRSEKLLV